MLRAQRGTLRIVITVDGVVFVGMQRRDAYYRNDPSKYGLNSNGVATRTSFISRSHGYGRSGLLLTCACVIETSSRPRPLHSVGFL